MQPDYQVRSLDADDVFRAFAIMRAVMPWLQLDQWQDMTATARQRRDWLAAVDDDGYIHGLCHVFPREIQPVSRHLEVPVFAPVSLFDEKGVTTALFETVMERALAEGCNKIHIWTAAPPDWDSLVTMSTAAIDGQGMFFDVIARRKLH